MKRLFLITDKFKNESLSKKRRGFFACSLLCDKTEGIGGEASAKSAAAPQVPSRVSGATAPPDDSYALRHANRPTAAVFAHRFKFAHEYGAKPRPRRMPPRATRAAARVARFRVAETGRASPLAKAQKKILLTLSAGFLSLLYRFNLDGICVSGQTVYLSAC